MSNTVNDWSAAFAAVGALVSALFAALSYFRGSTAEPIRSEGAAPLSESPSVAIEETKQETANTVFGDTGEDELSSAVLASVSAWYSRIEEDMFFSPFEVLAKYGAFLIVSMAASAFLFWIHEYIISAFVFIAGAASNFSLQRNAAKNARKRDDIMYKQLDSLLSSPKLTPLLAYRIRHRIRREVKPDARSMNAFDDTLLRALAFKNKGDT